MLANRPVPANELASLQQRVAASMESARPLSALKKACASPEEWKKTLTFLVAACYTSKETSDAIIAADEKLQNASNVVKNVLDGARLFETRIRTVLEEEIFRLTKKQKRIESDTLLPFQESLLSDDQQQLKDFQDILNDLNQILTVLEQGGNEQARQDRYYVSNFQGSVSKKNESLEESKKEKSRDLTPEELEYNANIREKSIAERLEWIEAEIKEADSKRRPLREGETEQERNARNAFNTTLTRRRENLRALLGPQQALATQESLAQREASSNLNEGLSPAAPISPKLIHEVACADEIQKLNRKFNAKREKWAETIFESWKPVAETTLGVSQDLLKSEKKMEVARDVADLVVSAHKTVKAIKEINEKERTPEQKADLAAAEKSATYQFALKNDRFRYTCKKLHYMSKVQEDSLRNSKLPMSQRAQRYMKIMQDPQNWEIARLQTQSKWIHRIGMTVARVVAWIVRRATFARTRGSIGVRFGSTDTVKFEKSVHALATMQRRKALADQKARQQAQKQQSKTVVRSPQKAGG